MEPRMQYPRRVWLVFVVTSLVLILSVVGCTTASEEVTEGTTDEFSLTGVVWEWESLAIRGSEGSETISVDEPSRYTIIFNEDGTLNGMADCNNYAGTYTTENGGVQITLGPTTMAFCGEESLDGLFLDTLGQIVAGGPDGTGKLALESGGGTQRMEFRNGGAAE